jgi:hypothetical protein
MLSEGHSFSCAIEDINDWALAPEVCSSDSKMLSAVRKKRTPAAAAGSVEPLYGTAEAVPFRQQPVEHESREPREVRCCFSYAK